PRPGRRPGACPARRPRPRRTGPRCPRRPPRQRPGRRHRPVGPAARTALSSNPEMKPDAPAPPPDTTSGGQETAPASILVFWTRRAPPPAPRRAGPATSGRGPHSHRRPRGRGQGGPPRDRAPEVGTLPGRVRGRDGPVLETENEDSGWRR